jgi:CO dehydrogenase maturation factor
VKSLKIAVSGKGGVGKTTLSAMLASYMALSGRRVIAVDADPDSNLAAALSVPLDRQLKPLSEMRELIAERTGGSGGYGGYFKLNPKVSDIPDKYACRIGPIHLLVLGGVAKGGAGCICPASALLKSLLTHLLLRAGDVVILDMEAGIEHLGRATAQGVDVLLVVVDGSSWSVQTAQRIAALARDIGLDNVAAVVNRLPPSADVEDVRRRLGGIPLIAALPNDEAIASGQFVRVLDEGRIEGTDALRRHLPEIESIVSTVTGGGP